MLMIQIRRDAQGPWVAAKVLEGERAGHVEVSVDGEALWVPWDDVYPADQVLLLVEQQARQRYAWVPKSDPDQPG
jgi:hypothetical protein